MNPVAIALNESLKENPLVHSMLSKLGEKYYFPKGILTQTAEAKNKATKINATIGIAEEDNEPMHLASLKEQIQGVESKDIFPYAPPGGKLDLRQEWKEKIVFDNQSLHKEDISLPIVTNAITHGLSVVADLFCDENDRVVIPDKLWGNYKLLFETRKGACISNYSFFNENNQFNDKGLEDTISQSNEEKLIILLNFPNNPTGYTPSELEVKKIKNVLVEQANLGKKLLVLVDDAYFGLFYEDSNKESVFAELINIHPNILPVKLDGATKEEFAWGLRVGFITFPFLGTKVNEALEKKIFGIIRSTISSGSHPSQSLVLQTLRSSNFRQEQKDKFNVLQERAMEVKNILDNTSAYKEVWSYYPFNSGYFMCLKLHNLNAERLRMYLLEHYGVGTIAINETDLRIAFSCVEKSDLKNLFDIIYEASVTLSREKHEEWR
ncbi:aminotransferase class I/II-fold pyridoxal phosphate-dependent enzyme [Alteribacillus sp. HJP-4]|uniref:aminotransferase class I/II-fold pyridoxal phosphate-dependent enzyme n=1 Tax=Alteribacillus sp. HJP-4 TaxID=2775394 RepID=UPI0035CD2832